jgi:hypothetical protein
MFHRAGRSRPRPETPGPHEVHGTQAPPPGCPSRPLVVTHDPAVSSQVRRTIAIRDGKTSSETIRHAATDEQGETTVHAREYATLDRAGRVQLPREMTRRLGLRNRVELQEEPDHIGVWPDRASTDQAADSEQQ